MAGLKLGRDREWIARDVVVNTRDRMAALKITDVRKIYANTENKFHDFLLIKRR